MSPSLFCPCARPANKFPLVFSLLIFSNLFKYTLPIYSEKQIFFSLRTVLVVVIVRGDQRGQRAAARLRHHVCFLLDAQGQRVFRRGFFRRGRRPFERGNDDRFFLFHLFLFNLIASLSKCFAKTKNERPDENENEERKTNRISASSSSFSICFSISSNFFCNSR